jgi:chromosome partitioning protein
MRTVVISVASQKGGCGKTTLALHLAVAAEQAGYATVVIDMDLQGTAEAWSEWRKDAPPPVIPAKAPTLARTLEKAVGHGAEFVVIDTPPIAEAEARAAAKAADLVLVPCRPNAFDLHSIKTTAELPSLAERATFAIFNAGPVSAAKLYAETTDIVTEFGLRVAPVRLSDRATFRHATGSGQSAQEIEPSGKAASEIEALWKWVCQQVGMSTRQRVNTQAKVSA